MEVDFERWNLVTMPVKSALFFISLALSFKSKYQVYSPGAGDRLNMLLCGNIYVLMSNGGHAHISHNLRPIYFKVFVYDFYEDLSSFVRQNIEVTSGL